MPNSILIEYTAIYYGLHWKYLRQHKDLHRKMGLAILSQKSVRRINGLQIALIHSCIPIQNKL